MDNLDQIIEESGRAIFEIESSDAKKLLKKLEEFVAGQNIENENPEVYKKLKDLQIKLRVVAFPSLPDDESADVLRHHYLESFDIEVPMKNQLTAKLFLAPYLVRNDVRKILQTAILENDQLFGGLTVGNWILEFEKMFKENASNLSFITQFAVQHPKARLLGENEKRMLKEILHNYEYYLVAPLLATGSDLDEILKSIPDEEVASAGTPYYAQAPGFSNVGARMRPTPRSSAPASMKNLASGPIVKMSLNEALQKFENLGEQLITGSPLKLKILPGAVRPSIKNWIMDYHQALGAGAHETMDRGNYLYHSENGKKLTTGERQKLAVVLKSLDESELLAVDSGKQEVLFGNYELGIRNYESDKKEPSVKVTRQISDSMLAANQELGIRNYDRDGGVRFSAPQKFPVERKDFGYQPYKISPLGYGRQEPANEEEKPEPKISGNVVDLSGK